MILGGERVPNSRIILHNLEGEDIDDWVHAFEENEGDRTHRRKNNVILTHEILSWHPDDTPNLTLEAIEDMARQYIQERNPNGLYVGAIHLSQNHYHVHFCVSGVEYRSGKAMRLSKKEFHETKSNTQAYQKQQYPELSNSLVSHGNAKTPQLSDREYWRSRQTGEPSTKELVFQLVKEVQDKATSIEELESLLQKAEVELYRRNGKVQGVIFKGRKYRLKRLGITLEYSRELQPIER